MKGGVRDTAILQRRCDTKLLLVWDLFFFFFANLCGENTVAKASRLQPAADPTAFPTKKCKLQGLFWRVHLEKREVKGENITRVCYKTTGREGCGGGGDNRATEHHASMCYEVLQPFTTRNKSIKCQPLMEHVGEKKKV